MSLGQREERERAADPKLERERAGRQRAGVLYTAGQSPE